MMSDMVAAKIGAIVLIIVCAIFAAFYAKTAIEYWRDGMLPDCIWNAILMATFVVLAIISVFLLLPTQ